MNLPSMYGESVPFYKKKFFYAGLLLLAAAAVAAYFFIKKIKSTQEEGVGTPSFAAEADGVVIRRTGGGKATEMLQTGTVDFRPIGSVLHLPTRVVCSSVYSAAAGPIRILENAETTQIYSEYLSNSANLAVSELTYKKQKDLYEAKVVPERDMLEARLKYQQALVAVNKSVGDIRNVIGVPVTLISSIPPGWVLMTADVPESELGAVRQGAILSIEFSAFSGKRRTAAVEGIADQINPISRTARIYFRMHNTENHLSAGMFGTADLDRGERSLLSVPAEAVIQIGSTSYVFVVQSDSVFRRVEVKTGLEDDGYISIESGLTRGQVVVTKGSELLKGISLGY